MFCCVIHRMLGLYARILSRLSVTGREYIPEQGPFLLIVNHLSSADVPVVLSVIPAGLKMTGMAAMAHRKDFFVGWLMDQCDAVWVRRGQSDRKALRRVLELLAAGRPLGVAPEGTRSRTGALIEAKSGATYLAIKAGVPVLPIGLAYTDKVYPSLRRLRRATVQVKIARLFFLPPRGDDSRSEHMQYCTELMMTRLASLLPEACRGFYAGHPLISYWDQLDASGAADRPEWKKDTIPMSI